MVSASGVGVSTAAATAATTIQYRRFLDRNAGVITPNSASSMMINGSSNDSPNARMSVDAKLKYDSAVMIGSSSPLWNPSSTLKAAGRIQM